MTAIARPPGPPAGGSQPDVLYASTPSATANPTVKLADRPTRRDSSRWECLAAPARRAPPDLRAAPSARSRPTARRSSSPRPRRGAARTNLYVRENPMSSSASTTQVDTGIGGGGVFLAATSDGSNVYFMDGAGNSLYDYNTTTNHLTDLTPAGERRHRWPCRAQQHWLRSVLCRELGAGIEQQLVRSGRHRWPAEPVSAAERRSHQDDVHRDAERKRQQRLERGLDFSGLANGSFIAFTTTNALNTSDPTNTVPHQIYVFNSGTGKLDCGSRAPGGVERPSARRSILRSPRSTSPMASSSSTTCPTLGSCSSTPRMRCCRQSRTTASRTCTSGRLTARDRARVRPTTAAACLSCPEARAIRGRTSRTRVRHGNNAFFPTFSQLVPQDTDTAPDYYDARVDGGFPATAPPPSCQGDGWKPPESATPAVPVVATVTFFGPGNIKGSTSSPAPKKKSKKKKSTR